MDHRYGQRVDSHSKVLIYERGIPISTGIALNSSRYGFFVKTNHLAVKNQLLEIEIVERGNRGCSRAPHRRIKCVVVHSKPDGFGVEIGEVNINEFSAIAAMRAFTADPSEISTFNDLR